jgi:hypothetical protein
LRVNKLELLFGVAKLCLLPNSSTTLPTLSLCLLAELAVDDENVDLTEGVGGESGPPPFSLSLFDPPERRKLSPKMDLRPLPLVDFSSIGENSPFSMLGEGVLRETSEVEDLREKKGMPEGVRRGLMREERERPGLVAKTEGGGKAEDCEAVWFVRVVLALLWLDVRVRVNEGTLPLRILLRPREPVPVCCS